MALLLHHQATAVQVSRAFGSAARAKSYEPSRRRFEQWRRLVCAQPYRRSAFRAAAAAAFESSARAKSYAPSLQAAQMKNSSRWRRLFFANRLAAFSKALAAAIRSAAGYNAALSGAPVNGKWPLLANGQVAPAEQLWGPIRRDGCLRVLARTGRADCRRSCA